MSANYSVNKRKRVVIELKQEKEIEVVTLMIRLYCKKQHKKERKAANVGKKDLCPECQEL